MNRSLTFFAGWLVAVALSVPMAAIAKNEDRQKTVVIGLKARRGVDPALGEAMSDIVQGEYSSDRRRLVFGRADVRRLMEFEAEKRLMGCDSDSCLSEIADALDVDRIVTGSLDKIGSSYFVVINELESDGVAPIARVQGRVPLDEDKLFKAVADMSRELMKKSRRFTNEQRRRAPPVVDQPADSTPADPAPSDPSPENKYDDPDEYGKDAKEDAPPRFEPGIRRGLVVTSATPATVFIGEEDYGETPVAIEDLPAGDYTVALHTSQSEPVMLDVTVYADGVTTVETDFDRALAPPAEEVAAYESAKDSHLILGISKVAGGAATTLLLAPCVGFTTFGLLGAAPPNVAGFSMLATCGAVSLVGCGLAGWGVFDFFAPPEEPESPGMGTQVLILPPEGEGDRKSFGIPASTMAH